MSDKDKFEMDGELLDDKQIKVLAAMLRSVAAAACDLDSEDHEDDDEVDEAIQEVINQFKEKKEIYNSNADRIIAQLEKTRKAKDDNSKESV